MSSSSRFALLLVAASGVAPADNGFMLGGGLEADSEDGLSLALLGGVELGDDTFLSASAARSTVDLTTGVDIDAIYMDVEIDHFFDPLGIRLGAAYWGDPDILESRDWRAGAYWRGDRAYAGIDYEFRDFELTTPGTDFFPGRRIAFDAGGIGASLRFDLGENADLRFNGMKYDYSVDFSPLQDRDIVDLITVSRLSLINTLVDSRVSATFGVDAGQRRWEIGVSTWESTVAVERTWSYTIRFLMPASDATDIEFGLGYDDSDLYGEATFLSVYLYFYGD